MTRDEALNLSYPQAITAREVYSTTHKGEYRDPDIPSVPTRYGQDFEYTGEFRPAKHDEYYLSKDPGFGVIRGSSGHASPRLILRPKKRLRVIFEELDRRPLLGEYYQNSNCLDMICCTDKFEASYERKGFTRREEEF